MAKETRPSGKQPSKKPAVGSRRTGDEARERASDDRRSSPPRADKPQKDVPPGRHALDD
jgi:hypothetical protein